MKTNMLALGRLRTKQEFETSGCGDTDDRKVVEQEAADDTMGELTNFATDRSLEGDTLSPFLSVSIVNCWRELPSNRRRCKPDEFLN